MGIWSQEKPKLKKKKLTRKAEDMVKNIVPGKMTYISELGYGSTPYLKQNISQFKTEGNPIVASNYLSRIT